MTLCRDLQDSLAAQVERLEDSITLSPTESFPLKQCYSDHLHRISNLYVFPTQAGARAKRIFAGRTDAWKDFETINDIWASRLRAKKLSLAPLSGLHAHTLLALALREHGKRVLLLPEEAGGHTHTEGILLSLGFEVVRMPVDYANLDIDMPATKAILDAGDIDIVFVDRSEGLNYTDFSPLLKGSRAYAIFDASHFLANILAGDYTNPFDMGFDLCVATLHKSLPGPQKAVVWSKEDDGQWRAIARALSLYLSSVHTAGVYAAGFVISNIPFLREYSRLVMQNAVALEDELHGVGVPVAPRKREIPPSYYVFLPINDPDRAYRAYTDLAQAAIDTNYRYLPFSLGYGIRLGTCAATMAGLRPSDTKDLATLFADVYFNGPTERARAAVRSFAARIRRNRMDGYETV